MVTAAQKAKASKSKGANVGGRPRLHQRTGPGYKFANWLDEVGLPKLGMTNEELMGELGYARPHIISMWRSGQARIPMERLPDLARLMKVDIGFLFALWIEQYTEDKKEMKPITDFITSCVGPEEKKALEAIRVAGPGGLSDDQLKAVALVAKSDKNAKAAIDAIGK